MSARDSLTTSSDRILRIRHYHRQLLQDHKHAKDLPVDARVMVLDHHTRKPAPVYHNKTGNHQYPQPMVVGPNGSLSGWVSRGQRLELVSRWSGGERMSASRHKQVVITPPKVHLLRRTPTWNAIPDIINISFATGPTVLSVDSTIDPLSFQSEPDIGPYIGISGNFGLDNNGIPYWDPIAVNHGEQIAQIQINPFTLEASTIPHDHVPQFSPASVPGYALDLDASALSGLSNSDPMATWNDESESTTLSLNPDNTSQPIFRTAVQNGLPGVYFDGHSGFVLTPSIDVAVADGWCVFWVLRPNDPMSDQFGNVLANDGNTGFWVDASDNSGHPNELAYYSTIGDGFRSTPLAVGTTQVTAASIATDGIVELFVDGTLTATSNPGTGEDETFDGIGSDNSPGDIDLDAYAGYIFRVLVYNQTVSSDNQSAIIAYLQSQWGL